MLLEIATLTLTEQARTRMKKWTRRLWTYQAENNGLESLKSVGGFTRGQGGKIRFNKTI